MKNILIVEDDIIIHNLIKKILEKEQYNGVIKCIIHIC